MCYFTTVSMAIGISENSGNARIVPNNNIRDFIRDTREIRGEYMVLV